MSCTVSTRGSARAKTLLTLGHTHCQSSRGERQRVHATPPASGWLRLSVCSKQQQQQPVMWSSSFCSAGLKQMGYLEPTSFALVEKGQKRNENPLTVQHWMYLISQFTPCFAASLGTILLCIFKSNCHLPHQHSADPGMQSGAEKKQSPCLY